METAWQTGMTRAVFVLPVRLRHLFDGCMEETSTPPIQSTNVQVTTPRSSNLADRESPGSTGMGSLHVPVVMKSPTSSPMSTAESSLTSQASAATGSPSTFLPTPSMVRDRDPKESHGRDHAHVNHRSAHPLGADDPGLHCSAHSPWPGPGLAVPAALPRRDRSRTRSLPCLRTSSG